MSTEGLNQESELETELAGHLIFLKRFAGSKSERLFPMLIPFDGHDGVWVRHQDDDSFNHATLRPWHRQCAQLKGIKTPEGLFVIREVNKAVDPAEPHE
jgi:hypothetical protein